MKTSKNTPQDVNNTSPSSKPSTAAVVVDNFWDFTICFCLAFMFACLLQYLLALKNSNHQGSVTVSFINGFVFQVSGNHTSGGAGGGGGGGNAAPPS